MFTYASLCAGDVCNKNTWWLLESRADHHVGSCALHGTVLLMSCSRFPLADAQPIVCAVDVLASSRGRRVGFI